MRAAGAQGLPWAGAAGCRGYRERGAASFVSRQGVHRAWKHAWGIEEKYDFTQRKLNWKFVGPSD